MYITPDMTDEEIAIVKANLGLDKSMPEQYLAWLKEALQGNFGQSLSYKQPAMPMLTKRLPDTILLMGASLFVSLIVSIPLGLIAGYKKNTWIDNAISAFAYLSKVTKLVPKKTAWPIVHFEFTDNALST